MRARVLLAASMAVMVSACQILPSQPVVTRAETAEAEPVGVAATVSDRPTEGMTENDWGGEVPQTKPATAVSEGGLGDLD